MFINKKFLQALILILSLGSFGHTYSSHDQTHSHNEPATQESSLNCIDCYINTSAVQLIGLDFRTKYAEFLGTSVVSNISYGIYFYDIKIIPYQSRAP
jgi:hypothetical protein